MTKIQKMGAFTLILRKIFKCTLIILLCSQWANNVHCETESPPLSNDQETTIGCPIPDLRFVRAKTFPSTTESSSSSLDTTQAPNEILSTSNVASDHHIEDARLTEEGAHTSSLRQTRYTDYNPYAWNSENGDQVHLPGNSDAHLEETPNENGKRIKRMLHRTKNKRRLKHHSHVHRHNERNIKHNYIDDAHNSVHASKRFDNNGTNLEPVQLLNAENNNTNDNTESMEAMIFGMHDNGFHYSQDGTVNHHGNNNISNKQTDGRTMRIKFVHKSGKIIHKIALQRAQCTDIGFNEHDNITEIESNNENNKFNETSTNEMVNENMKNISEPEFVETANQNYKNAEQLQLARVKRKSGKATGALSRPKGGSDSGSKSTSRKKDAGYEEEAGYIPHGPDEPDEESEEEEEEEDETIHFDEITEVHFPGEIGPIGDRRLCKIRCVKGKWIGPLCTSGEDGEIGHTKFQPLYKSCNVNRIPSHLLLSYKNISVNVGWDVPHGHSLQARCKDLGLYKLLGESRVLCSNGLWAPRMPSCVPTTLLTNFSDDSPPSIRIKIGSGSGAFEPSGVLAVLPGSTIYLDCMYLKKKGTPEWTWTGWHRTYQTGWHNTPDEKPSKFRLTIKEIQQQESGTYTCASPRGNTNSIQLIVTSN